MNRSKNYVFLSHCILAQAARAKGLAKYHPAAVKPVIQFCLDNDINMVQMPCPETRCAAGGVGRDPHGKKWYEDNGLRETCSSLAIDQAVYMKQLIEGGFNILAVIGIEFSPACAPEYLNRGPVVIKDQGIFIEELKEEITKLELNIKFMGVNMRWHKKLERDLRDLIPYEKGNTEEIAPAGKEKKNVAPGNDKISNVKKQAIAM